MGDSQAIGEKKSLCFQGIPPPGSNAYHCGVEFLALRVRDEVPVEACAAGPLERAFYIELRMNYAGYTMIEAFNKPTADQAQAPLDTNVLGTLDGIRAMLPAKRTKGADRIVNMSSVLGSLPAPFIGAYASSKHAEEGLSESLYHEVRGFGIRAVLLQADSTRTDRVENAVSSATSIEAYDQLKQRLSVAIGKAMRRRPAWRPSRPSPARGGAKLPDAAADRIRRQAAQRATTLHAGRSSRSQPPQDVRVELIGRAPERTKRWNRKN